MKFGFRTPSPMKSIKARTTGRIKRKAKSMVNPFYGKKGMGLLNPEKAVYNKIYNKTSFGSMDVINYMKPKKTNQSQTKITNNNIKKILKDLKELAYKVNTTVSPNIFFDSYEQLVLGLRYLSENEAKIKFQNKQPSDNLREILNKRVSTINEFIERYYNEIDMKLNILKQNTAKINNINKFYNSLKNYDKYMDKENILKYENLYKELKQKILK